MTKRIVISLIIICISVILVAGCTNTGTQTKPTPTPIVTSPSCEMSLDAPKEVVEESRLKLCDSAGVCETGPSIHSTIKPKYFETENNPYYDMLIVRLKNNCNVVKSGEVLVKVYSDPEKTNVIQTKYGYYSNIAPDETVNVKIMIDTGNIDKYYYTTWY